MSQVIQATDDTDEKSPELSIADKKEVPGDDASDSDDGLDEKYRPKQPPNEKERKSRLDELLKTDKTLQDMNLSQRYDFVDQYGQAGNTFFKEGQIEWAAQTYQEAMTMVQHGLHIGLQSDDPDEKPVDSIQLGGPGRKVDMRGKETMMSFGSNLALCHLKLKNYDKALAQIEKAENYDDLVIPPKMQTKLSYRRGEALIALNKPREALEAYNKAIRIDPKDVATRNALAKTKAVVRAMDKEELETAKLIWSKKLPKFVEPEKPPTKGLASSTSALGLSYILKIITSMLQNTWNWVFQTLTPNRQASETTRT